MALQHSLIFVANRDVVFLLHNAHCPCILNILQTPVLVLLILEVVGAEFCPVPVVRSSNIQTLVGSVDNLVALDSPLPARVASELRHLQRLSFCVVLKHEVVQRRSYDALLVRIPQLVLRRWTFLAVHNHVDTG